MTTKTFVLFAYAFFVMIVSAAAQNNSADKMMASANASKISIANFSKTAPPTIFYADEDRYRKFKKMRTGGIVLTSVGAALMGSGIALIAAGVSENDNVNYSNYDVYDMTSGDDKIVGGALCLATGFLSTGGGITMWVIGNKKMKKYSSGATLQVNPGKLSLAYKF